MIFVIIGLPASGKTKLAKYLTEHNNFELALTTTTRPMREGEIEGVDYFFIEPNQFNHLNLACKFHTRVEGIGPVSYGLDIDQFEEDKDYVVVLNPDGYRELKEVLGDRVCGIYLKCNYLDIMTRYVEREPNNPNAKEEVFRRLRDDADMFTLFEFEVEETIINKDTFEDMALRANLITTMRCFDEQVREQESRD